MFDYGCAVQTSLRRILFTRNVHQPQLQEFFTVEPEIKEAEANNQQLFWRVFSPRLIISEKVELHIVHPHAGVVQAIEGDGKRVFYNQEKASGAEGRLPHLKAVKYISGLSPNGKYVVYFQAEPLFKENPVDQIPQKKGKKTEQEKPVPYGFAYRVIIAPSISAESMDSNRMRTFELPFIREGGQLNLSQQPKGIKWCGNHAITLQLWNEELYLLSLQGDVLRIEKDRGEKEKWSVIREELDGSRIISRRENKILREVPRAYQKVFEPFGEEPGALLKIAYAAFEDEEPLQDDEIRKEKKKLAEGVTQCVESARFEVSLDNAVQLMKGSFELS